jgi:predicted MPP superfamily phosphohydrolase
MNIVEILISGFSAEKLEKPFVFISMLIAYLFFMVIFIVLLIDAYKNHSPAKFLLAAFVLLLSGLCFQLIKKCFKRSE